MKEEYPSENRTGNVKVQIEETGKPRSVSCGVFVHLRKRFTSIVRGWKRREGELVTRHEREKDEQESLSLVIKGEGRMVEEIAKMIAEGRGREAAQAITRAKQEGKVGSDWIVLEAELAVTEGRIEEARRLLAEGLEQDPKHSEFFVVLGEIYSFENSNLAYLCFEQALLYCQKEEDEEMICAVMEEMRKRCGFRVRETSFLIVSYNDRELMKECVSSIRKSVRRGTYEIVVVDNRSTDGVQKWLRDQLDIRLIENGRNVGYPTGMNIAYRACRKENDIFMLNNDAVLTPNAYFWLRMALYAGREVGAVGPMSNEASGQTISPTPGTMEETFLLAKGINLPSENPCEEALSLTGFAVLIGAEAAKSVSMEKDIMDDRYSPAYFEDDDLSVRILYAGYRNRIVHNALVYHKGGSGFPEGNVKEEEEKVPAQAKMELLQKSRKQFIDKWGFDIWAYKGVWTEFADVIDKEQGASIRILELDCGMGANLCYLQYRFPESVCVGIDRSPLAVGLGKRAADLRYGDCETFAFPWRKHSFDYIFAVDALERAADKASFTGKLADYLKEGGFLVSHHSLLQDETIQSLLREEGFVRTKEVGELFCYRYR